MMALLVNGEGIQKEAIKKSEEEEKKKRKGEKKNRNEKKKSKKNRQTELGGEKRVLSQVWKCNGMENAGGMTADSAGRGWNSGMPLIVLCSWMSSAAVLNEVDRL